MKKDNRPQRELPKNEDPASKPKPKKPAPKRFSSEITIYRNQDDLENKEENSSKVKTG